MHSPPAAAFEPAASRVAARHAPLTIALHWLTVLSVAVLVLLAVGREIIDLPGADRALLQAHRALGPVVLILVILRLAARLAYTAPQHPQTSHHAEQVARAAHAVLYLLLLAVPLLGWVATNAEGKVVSLIGLVPLPALVGRNEDLADLLGDAHSFAAWTLVGLIGLHTVAALWHHFIQRDGVLAGMLPLVRSGDDAA